MSNTCRHQHLGLLNPNPNKSIKGWAEIQSCLGREQRQHTLLWSVSSLCTPGFVFLLTLRDLRRSNWVQCQILHSARLKGGIILYFLPHKRLLLCLCSHRAAQQQYPVCFKWLQLGLTSLITITIITTVQKTPPDWSVFCKRLLCVFPPENWRIYWTAARSWTPSASTWRESGFTRPSLADTWTRSTAPRSSWPPWSRRKPL